MALHDIHYQPWKGRHEGIWRRRAVIAGRGLRACLANRWMRYAVSVAWGLGLTQILVLFVMGQLLVEDSLVVQWAADLRGSTQAVVGGLATWLADHPEVSVRTAENVVFHLYSKLALTVNLVVVMLAIPHLITRDLSSNALLIYASKALTRWDYLLGKLGTLLGLLGLTWVGPACLAWFLGNLLAPEWHFFWHARVALLHTVVYASGAVLFLALLGLGVSALSSKEKSAVGLWLILWLVGNTLVPIGEKTSPWLQFLSFRHDLQQLSVGIYQPSQDLERLQKEIPMFGEMLRQAANRRPRPRSEPRVGPACLGLGLMGIGAALLLNARTKTE
jgi:hypothetical protein